MMPGTKYRASVWSALEFVIQSLVAMAFRNSTATKHDILRATEEVISEHIDEFNECLDRLYLAAEKKRTAWEKK